jgi:hypothetical protein
MQSHSKLHGVRVSAHEFGRDTTEPIEILKDRTPLTGCQGDNRVYHMT